MGDIVDAETRKRMMSRIRGKDTKPEVAIRKRLYAKGYRYRIHTKKLPGKPDIVFLGRKAAIFINGCFWHFHDCHLFRMPKTRQKWWERKLVGNLERDRRNVKALLGMGWRVMVIWECSWRTKKREQNYDKIANRITMWLKKGSAFEEIRGKE